jgi:HAD superfamily hydrolase (TIGR01549 family)
MTPLSAVAFDCDGVLFDTVKANTAYYNRILSRFGRPEMTPSQFEYAQMHTADEAIAHLFPEPAAFEAAQAFRREMGYGPFIPRMEMAPDLRGLLGWLKGRYRTAVVTNRSDTMSRVLTEFGLEGAFEVVVTALDVTHPKPHPEPLLKALKAFSLSPPQMLYIGDSPLDEQAAAAAGVRFAAYGNPDLTADYHVRRMTEIRTLLNGG